MSNVKRQTSHLIGDVVLSRRSVDRQRLHDTLSAALAEANDRFDGELAITVGDEYQGSFATLGAALGAAWWLQVHLQPEVDVRHGVGTGEVRLLDEVSGVQDGPGWWAAREAIETVEASARRPRTRSARTRYVAAQDDRADLQAAVNAALAGRDQIMTGLDARGLSVLRGMLAGTSQQQLALDEGISASAVSQRVRAQGVGVLLQMNDWLEGLG
ncbi:MAG: SatD family protein [Nocardioides sp.]|uniref:SatD family protein n=1 Tax=Nocardioides sp. TaxID=35761 RepID=UPI003EFF0DEE